MKKKLVGKIGALLMAAAMAFTSGTAVYADETSEDDSQDFALEFQSERDQNLLKDGTGDLIEEGDGYEMLKGTELDDGGYTTWIFVSANKVKGDLNSTISTLLDKKSVLKESYLSLFLGDNSEGYGVSKSNLEKMKAKKMMFIASGTIDDKYYGYEFPEVENVYGDFAPSMTFNTDSRAAQKVKEAGIDKFYTFTSKVPSQNELLSSRGEIYTSSSGNLGGFVADTQEYSTKYASNMRLYYYNSTADKFQSYEPYNSRTGKGDASAGYSEYSDVYKWTHGSIMNSAKLNGTYVVTQGEIPAEYLMDSYTGLSHEGNDWLYYKNGKVDSTYTGLCKYNGSWWYVKNGKIDFSATTLCKYNGSWWYVKNGKIDFSATTLCKCNGSWWYVQGGKVNFNAATLCKYNGSWFYVSGGQVRFGATGLCKYNGSWFYVQGGKVNFGATTLCKYNGNWFYVQGGVVKFKTTLCKYNGTWWYVKNGVLNTSTTLCKYNNTWFAVSGGKVAWGYTGNMKYNGGTFKVVNGIVRF